MARIVFVTGWLRSSIHSATALDVSPKLVTVTPADGNLPIYVNPAQVVMVKTDAGERSTT